VVEQPLEPAAGPVGARGDDAAVQHEQRAGRELVLLEAHLSLGERLGHELLVAAHRAIIVEGSSRSSEPALPAEEADEA
jgi:hypothetical protein